MAGKLIAVANMKGGVGKTTTVVSLAEALSASDPKASVLVVDLDPQASASVCLAGEDLMASMIMGGRSVEAFLDDRLIESKRPKLAPLIHPTISKTTHCGNQLNIAFLPCGPDLRIVERQIVYELTEKGLSMKGIEAKVEKLFREEFAALDEIYDYIIFDCPPGISPMSEAAIKRCDLVIVPTIPDFISVYGLRSFLGIFWRTQRSPPRSGPPNVLVTRFHSGIRQHKEYVARLEEAASLATPEIRLFRTRIHQSADLAKALDFDGTPNFKRKYGTMVPTLANLVDEVKGALHAH
jgi:chromosome partitioning protein